MIKTKEKHVLITLISIKTLRPILFSFIYPCLHDDFKRDVTYWSCEHRPTSHCVLYDILFLRVTIQWAKNDTQNMTLNPKFGLH